MFLWNLVDCHVDISLQVECVLKRQRCKRAVFLHCTSRIPGPCNRVEACWGTVCLSNLLRANTFCYKLLYTQDNHLSNYAARRLARFYCFHITAVAVFIIMWLGARRGGKIKRTHVDHVSKYRCRGRLHEQCLAIGKGSSRFCLAAWFRQERPEMSCDIKLRDLLIDEWWLMGSAGVMTSKGGG